MKHVSPRPPSVQPTDAKRKRLPGWRPCPYCTGQNSGYLRIGELEAYTTSELINAYPEDARLAASCPNMRRRAA
jgi:hypothetical protein